MKKSLILLFLVVSTGLLRAYDFQMDSLCYNILTDQTNAVEVTYEVYNNQSNYSGLTHAVIPDSVTYQGATYRVTRIANDAFRSSATLKYVAIPSSMTSIGNYAFDYCDSLRSIYWDAANYNQTRGSSPFHEVRTHVTEFTIGPNVTSLPQFLCFQFTALTSVEIPAAVHKLGTSAFDECTSLQNLTWHEGLDSIGEYAFKNCSTLTELTIPQSVTWIGKNAFESCTSLSSLTLNDNDKALKDNVFKYCNSLTELTIPAAWRAIPNQAFSNMTGLEQVILPDSLDTIGNSAFSYCRKLRAIAIPSTLKYIDNYAFDYCDSLRSIYWDAANYNQTRGSSPFHEVRAHVTEFTIGPNVTSLPQFLCFQFTALTSVEIPAAVHKLGTSAFDECTSLSDLTWHEGLDSIGEYAFKNCSTLTELTIPQSVTWIGKNAFESCTSLSSLTLNDNDKALKDNVFKYCNNLTELTIPAAWRAIPNQAFSNMTGLEQVILPDSLDTIGNSAFSYCRKLRAIAIPSTLKYIDNYAFDYCDSLQSIYWDAANYNQTRGSSPFHEVRAHVTEFTIGPNVTSLPQFLCFQFTALTSVEIPAAVHKLGTSAFDECTSLQNLTWHEGLDSIGEYAFKNCSTLTELTIPQSVTWIGQNAFESCPLTEMTSLATTPPTITNNTFYNVDKSIPVSVPAGTRSRYRAATGWSDFTNYVALPCEAPLTDTVVETICEGSAYEWHGLILTESGVYMDSLLTEDGCDSINILVLTVNPSYFFTEEAQICQGNRYTWRGRSLETAGTYYDSLMTVLGCDSIYQLTLDVNPMYEFYDSASVCEGTPYIWHSREYLTAGIYYDSLQTLAGCDSIYRLTLTVRPTYAAYDTAAICYGETYTWNDQPYSAQGDYEMTFEAQNGCDSVAHLHLTENPVYFYSDTITLCENMPYEWHGRTIKATGNYYDSLQTVYGCDSIYELVATVNQTYASEESAEICEGDAYTWYDQVYTETGEYQTTLTALNGCDSVVTLHLTVNPTYFFEEDASTCEGTAYAWHGRDLATAGIYYDSLQTLAGCDSIYRLILTVRPTYAAYDTAAICYGETYTWNGQPYSAQGDYEVTFEAQNGCDSIAYLHLTENPVYFYSDTITLCENMPYEWHGRTIKATGNYYDSLQTVYGCDSIYELVATVNQTYASDESAEICEGDAYTWYDQVYTETGTYETTLTALNGCDSVVTLHLTVNPTAFIEETGAICQGGTYAWHRRVLTEAGIYYDTLQTIHGCDSIYQLTLTVNPTYATDLSADICQGETYTWNGQQYTAQGNYDMTLTALNGCDSVVTLHLTVNPTFFYEESAVTCQGSAYNWHGRDLTTAGVYYDSLQTVTGCDSIYRLILTVKSAAVYNETGTICEGESYTWRDRVYTTAGLYSDTIRYTESGCDSAIYNLTLTVRPTYLNDETAVTCQGTPYSWHGRDLYQSGIYYDTLHTVFGCDSVIRLMLTVHATYTVTEEAAICDGDIYTWHGRTYTKKGIYTDTLPTVTGCDSICTLVLTVNPKYLIEDIVSIREDKLPYIWQGEPYTEAGNYRKEFISIYGCDSVHTLQLIVTELPIYTVTVIADHGVVNGTGTYPLGTTIHLEAIPDEGFEFQMWSDGSEINPKDFVVTQDTTLRALFFMPEVEQEVVVDSIETNSVTIVWDTVAGATLYELRIFKNGELVVIYEVDPDNNIVGEHHTGPDRLIARKDSTGGSSETLQVSVGGLEPGQDYTYSLDAMDDDRSYVGAQSGSFTTEEEPDGLDSVLFDDRRLQPRKILQDGHLYIELPDGTRYSPEGALLDSAQ